jgi:hypothetical protein
MAIRRKGFGFYRGACRHPLDAYVRQPTTSLCLSSSGVTGRSSIPETVEVDRKGRGVLGSAFAEDDEGSPYAFFFTSLTLEKVIPSARSRV